MRRTPFLFAAVLAALPIIAAVPVLTVLAVADTPSVPQIPKELGYCVTVMDQTGTLIGIVQMPLHRPDPAKLDEFRASLRSAVNLIGRTTDRPDLIEASASIQLVDNPTPPLQTPRPTRKNPRLNSRTPVPIGCYMSCSCATPILCSTTVPIPAVDPITEVIRKNPGPPGGGICGCGGGCGACEKCVLVCPK